MSKETDDAERLGMMYGQMQALEMLRLTGAITAEVFTLYTNPLMLAKNMRRKVKHWPFNDEPQSDRSYKARKPHD